MMEILVKIALWGTMYIGMGAIIGDKICKFVSLDETIERLSSEKGWAKRYNKGLVKWTSITLMVIWGPFCGAVILLKIYLEMKRY